MAPVPGNVLEYERSLCRARKLRAHGGTMKEPTRLVTGPQAREEAGDAAAPTELAPAESETESARAWGLDEFDDDELPTTRLTPGRITGGAVAASLVAVAVAAVLAGMHLGREGTTTPTAATSSMVPATTIAVPVAEESPPLPPAPPPVTITTVIKQVPAPTGGWAPPVVLPSKPPLQGPLPDLMPYNDQFVANLRAHTWNIWDMPRIIRRGHETCQMLRDGEPRELIVSKLLTVEPQLTRPMGMQFTEIVSDSYPNCP